MAAKKSGPFDEREIALLGKDTDAAVAEKLGRDPKRVYQARARRGIPAFYEHSHHWTKRELRLLGTRSDREVAEAIGLSRVAVANKRLSLGIAAKHQGRPKQGRARKAQPAE